MCQVSKLLCFCTRPAIYSPPLNWLCEFISTIALVRLRVMPFIPCVQLGGLQLFASTMQCYSLDAVPSGSRMEQAVAASA